MIPLFEVNQTNSSVEQIFRLSIQFLNYLLSDD